ncbi:lysophospholipid acyltransferase family protein [Humisphaera borealis]|uniref:1-acyl-sn-glycerol-3-phosphate acyltransferase n=1 Tax=Humisphaera borealis TaxID=2807512 RepID=A0A7M2X369_9BACT|nr:lysophospholipid acyltransferase family protein [Humisphaera borealis]QOV91471.1 1-acyl-sn-glycerol-3-phosphate acyltransferase [Humisphaera borealis]
MSDSTYRTVVAICYPAFWVSGRPVVIGRKNMPLTGPVILAPTHLSHYDVPLLMAETPRNIDFMSVVEFLSVPFVGRLFTEMNCFFLDRGRVDLKSVRTALDRLKKGRLVSMFPEGHIREFDDSIIHGRPFKPGIARLAYLSGAPVVPCVVLGGDRFKKPSAWLPLMRTRYGVSFGQPLSARAELPEREAVQDLVQRLGDAYPRLYKTLSAAMDRKQLGRTPG